MPNLCVLNSLRKLPFIEVWCVATDAVKIRFCSTSSPLNVAHDALSQYYLLAVIWLLGAGKSTLE